MKDLQEKQLHEALVLACPETDFRRDCPCPACGIEHDIPFRLSHVLRALENSDKLRSGSWVTTTKWLCFYEAVTDNELCSYDLTTDSLSEQSPEFKSWLHNILCV